MLPEFSEFRMIAGYIRTLWAVFPASTKVGWVAELREVNEDVYALCGAEVEFYIIQLSV